MQRRENIFSSAVTNLKDWTERFLYCRRCWWMFLFFHLSLRGDNSRLYRSVIVLMVEHRIDCRDYIAAPSRSFNFQWMMKSILFFLSSRFCMPQSSAYCVDYAFNVTHIFSHRKFNTFIHSFHQWVAVGSESFCSVQLTEH